MATVQDDIIYFADDPEPSAPEQTAVWHVLLVDDDPDVHQATTLTLRNLVFEGRRLAFSHALSSAEAQQILRGDIRFAVAIVDVVMESGTAGLELVRYIREQLRDTALRIILRTGQPGYAPEMSTIQNYDINDYRTKSELNQTRLFTSLTMAIRSHAQIRQLELGRSGLEIILESTRRLGRPEGLNQFASGLLTQLCALLGVDCDSLVCAAVHPDTRQPYVMAAAGRYRDWLGLPLEKLPNETVRTSLQESLKQREHRLDSILSLYFAGVDNQALAAYVNIEQPLDSIQRGLLEVFCSNMSVAFENLQLYLDIETLAYQDALVGLPNRNALLLALSHRPDSDKVLALVDLDNFADINNILDENFGDSVLKAVAARLRACFPSDTLVARLASNLYGLYGPASQVSPDSIEAQFAEPFALEGDQMLRLSATTGLARPTGQSGPELLKNAGAALKQAKRQARGKALFFSTEQSHAARNRVHTLQMLRRALSEQHLQLHYQPFIRLKDRRPVGAECLLRWRTPDGQFIAPDVFIPIAEQSGLMLAIGEWVLRTALNWRASLQDRVSDCFRVAVNVSQVQFAEPDFVERLLCILQETGVPGHQLELELTESVAIENFDRLKSKLEQIQARGIEIAMDDFGTGYSSLSVLQQLSPNRLKIDRSFVSGDEHNDSFAMAETIIAMARYLELKTIAEGIETEEQCAAMQAAGCQDGQGYLFSRPLPEADFLKWLTAHNGG
ncbi:MAG: EAL domain-containing protein [Thiopseudomonas sp.]|nr:EAL domain-containing protein [Thiopseudomonas sp.]